ncbi:YXWGXW repeat-containing protein [Undibacterium sp. Rencai35W]|uniref:YXWGXW repeat-containing protein n=1 Tax=Undibacterium sp. Rencai35W TaxID=3413046 RepID=UPI003BEF8CEE
MNYVIRRIIATSLVLSAVGCAAPPSQRVVVREQPRVVIRQVPAPVQEVITVQPASGYAWVPGHWFWHHNEWEWQAGHWYQGSVRPMPAMLVEQITIAPSPNHYWIPGHWKWHGNEWEWVRGRWNI